MLDLHVDFLCLATAVVLALSPGPDTVLALSRTLASDTGAGLSTLLEIHARTTFAPFWRASTSPP